MMLLSLLTVLVFLNAAMCELVGLTCEQRKELVDGHNLRRLWLAKNMVPGQPAASTMNMMVWDGELQMKAERWASYMNFWHNDDKTIPSGRFMTGENLYIICHVRPHEPFNISKALSLWFDEYQDYSYGKITFADFSGPVHVGHYTQMAWSDSVYLGCGVSSYYRDECYNFLLVCNYGPPGNYITQYPYESDGPGSGYLNCVTGDCAHRYGCGC